MWSEMGEGELEGFKEEAFLLGLEGWGIRIKGAYFDVEHQLNLQEL